MRNVTVVFMIAGCLIYSGETYAEAIKLKSGKTIKGPVIERTEEYIRIEVQGVPIKFYLDEIKSIDGTSLSTAVNKDEVFYAEKADPKEWKEWFRDKKEYLRDINVLMQEAVDIEGEATLAIQRALNNNNYLSAQKVNRETAGRVQRIINQMQALSPPRELQAYHGKLIASCEYVIKALAALMKDKSAFAAYKVTSITFAFDAIRELRSLYNEHGASQESLDRLNEIIDNGFLKEFMQNPVS